MSPGEERLELLRARVDELRSEGVVASTVAEEMDRATATSWRTHGLVVQIVFFLLTSIGIATFYGFLAAMRVPAEGLVTGIAAIALAEYLIRARRWFGTGVEAALWLGGVIALITELPRTGTPESFLVIAAGVALAGLRVRNPLFGVAAAVLVVGWAEARLDIGFVVAIGLAAIALAALSRTWERPSTEWLWSLGAVILPLVGRSAADADWRLMTVALSLAFSATAFALALRIRHHACFAAAAAGAGVATVSMAQAIDARPEAVLASSGALLLAISLGVARRLRGRRTGFVVTPVRIAALDEGVVAIATAVGASQVATSRTAAGEESRPQDDGGFGGAGATGSY